jgi:copper chaperone CopZ
MLIYRRILYVHFIHKKIVMNLPNKLSALAVMTAFLLCFSIYGVSAKGRNSENKDIKTETFKVYGVCGMCKAIIENAAHSADGVVSQDWNIETQMFTVTYNTAKANLDVIKNNIVEAGYDIDGRLANEESRSKLSPCCQYDRTGKNNNKMVVMPAGTVVPPASNVTETEHK